MEVLDIAKEQLNSTDQGVILEDFGDYFAEIRNFGPEDPNYLRTVRQRVEELEEDEAGRARDALYDILEGKLNRLKRELNEAQAPGLILFVGNGVPDGHGILLDGYPWVVVDLKAFMDRLSTYDQEVYLTHEISHAFHYAKAPSFYFGNNQGFLQPPIFKMMIAEGVATYLSFLFTSGTIHRAYWFGQHSNEEVEEWMNLCEQVKGKIADKVDMSKGEVPSDLVDQLFDIPKRDLGKSRLGYYYGSKIVHKVLEEKDLKTAVNMGLKAYENYIFNYFDL